MPVAHLYSERRFFIFSRYNFGFDYEIEEMYDREHALFASKSKLGIFVRKGVKKILD